MNQLNLTDLKSSELCTRTKETFTFHIKMHLKLTNITLLLDKKMRKVTCIVYLTERDSSAISNIKGNGELRIHLNDKIIDVVPRTGRCLIFKSEKVTQF